MTKKKLFIIAFFIFLEMQCDPYTPLIVGVVTDAATGKPIENVVVIARWINRGFMDARSEYQVKLKATDKNGRFVIWPYWEPLFFSNLDKMDLEIKHPLYEALQVGVLVTDKSLSLRQWCPSGTVTGSRWGTVKYEIKLRSMDEIDKMPEEEKRRKGIEGTGPEYYLLAKKLGIKNNVLLEIFKESDSSITKYVSTFPDSNIRMGYYNEARKTILEILGKGNLE